MRLLHSTHLRFQEFFDSSIPPYAILSHRWGNNEVSYQALELVLADASRSRPNQALKLSGERFAKIQKCREQAATDGYEWVWIDTCCINKESTAELSEAINSMYRWYQGSDVCYIYLRDVDYYTVEGPSTNEEFWRALPKKLQDSEWFNRGWTLQELLAPRNAVFYDVKWRFISGRHELAEVIAQITGIGVELLRIQHSESDRISSIASSPVARKMSWLAKRSTSRIEDIAYCMLGIFNINMPLLYGEGRKAFMRLQLEIISKSDDESIFAWDLRRENLDPHYLDHCRSEDHDESGLLAVSPKCFADSGNVQQVLPFTFGIYRLPYAMTNQGLRFEVNVSLPEQALLLRGNAGASFQLQLNCSEIRAGNGPVEVSLQKIMSGRSNKWERYACSVSTGPRVRYGDNEEVPMTFYVPQSGL